MNTIPLHKGWINYFEPYLGDKFTDGKIYKSEKEAKNDCLNNDYRYLETAKYYDSKG